MSKRPLAALCALLAFMAVLVAVPLAASETAEAHPKTKQQCAFDPFAGNQCWTVNVPHSHGAGGGGRRPPTTTAPPPPTCPAGFTGTPPWCTRPTTTTTAPPPPTCPAGFTGTPPWCTRPPTTTTAPPPTTTTTAPPRPPRCATGHHRHGNTCHSHSFTPPCGTGTWAPHAGHTSKQRPPCPTTPPPTTTTAPPPTTAPPTTTTAPPPTTQPPPPPTTAPPECPKLLGTHPHLDREQHRHVMGSQRNRGGGTLSACHLVEASHCSSGQHEHVHGSQECHTLGKSTKNASGTHSGWTDHCASGEHSHEHSGSCHAADPPYYDGVKIEKTEIARGYICHTTNTKPHGEVKSCARVPEGSDLEKRIDDALNDAGIAGIGLLACTVVGVATAGTGGLLCGGAWIAATLIGEVLCLQPWCTKDPSPVYRWNTPNPPASGDDSDDDSGGGQPQADPNDPDGDYDGDGKTTAEEATEAAIKHQAGEITDAEYTRILRRYWCGSGDPSYTSYCNE